MWPISVHYKVKRHLREMMCDSQDLNPDQIQAVMLMGTSSYAIPDVTPPAIALRHGAVLFHISVDVASGSCRAQNLRSTVDTALLISQHLFKAALTGFVSPTPTSGCENNQ